MAYNPNDVFPGGLPQKQTDLATIVAAVDPSVDVPVTYFFGASAPTMININPVDGSGSSIQRMVLSKAFAGRVGDGRGVEGAQGRMFVEFSPYSWMPA